MSKLPVSEKTIGLSPNTEATLSLVQGIFPVVASIAMAIWIVKDYFDSKIDNHQQR